MPEIVEIEEFMKLNASIPIADVRSPGEFLHGHIPGAHNIPVFDNEERAQVGTTYKQVGKNQAIDLGLDLVGPKLESFRSAAKSVSKDNRLLVHCWRGGLRSEKMAGYFEEAGIQTYLLKGGYKAYRNFILKSFGEKLDIRLLAGETGSGKTEILGELQKAGEQVIDLEELASHRGSSFGAIGMDPQPTVENFENLLYKKLKSLDASKRIWVEAESRSIGRVFVPELFWAQMRGSKVYRLQVPFEARVQRLVHEYGKFPKEVLQEALDRIKKRLGGLDYKNATEALQRDDMAEFIRFALRYYDKAYDHPHKQGEYADVRICECVDGDPVTNAQSLLKLI